MPSRRSLRQTLLKWLLVPLLSLLVLSAIAAYGIALNFARDAFDRSLYESAYDVAQLVQKSVQDGKPPFPLPRAAHELVLADKYDDIYYNIRDPNGLILSGEESLAAPAAQANRSNGKPEQFYDAMIFGKPVRVTSLAFNLRYADHEQRILVQVAETLNKRKQLAKQILTGLILPQMLLIILAACVVWFAVGRGLRPLSRLEASVAERSHLDLSPVQAPDAPAEVQPLVNAINALLQRLQLVLNAQNRFIADAAHQLRTPLAGLKAQVALATRQQSLDDVRHSLNQLEIGTERLTHLVNQLLSVARNEPGADRSLQLVALDLNALVQATTSEWIGAAVRRNIDLGFEGPGREVIVSGDALRLNELLKNLLDNALRYTQAGGTVTVRVTTEPALEVEDNGPGIPQEEREKVFERFYRLLGNGADGSGLGLAIVKEIALTHGAQVQVVSGKDNTGCCFRILFPPQSAPS